MGIVAGEDSERELSEILAYFQNAGCATAICSCTDDTNNVDIIKEYATYTFINKVSETIDSLKRIQDSGFAKMIISHLRT